MELGGKLKKPDALFFLIHRIDLELCEVGSNSLLLFWRCGNKNTVGYLQNRGVGNESFDVLYDFNRCRSCHLIGLRVAVRQCCVVRNHLINSRFDGCLLRWNDKRTEHIGLGIDRDLLARNQCLDRFQSRCRIQIRDGIRREDRLRWRIGTIGFGLGLGKGNRSDQLVDRCHFSRIFNHEELPSLCKWYRSSEIA